MLYNWLLSNIKINTLSYFKISLGNDIFFFVFFNFGAYDKLKLETMSSSDKP